MSKAPIEGLKVTVPGLELLGMIRDEMERHQRRAQELEGQLAAIGLMVDLQAMSGNPKQSIEQAMKRHQAEADELDFLQTWLNVETKYVLGAADLRKLGKIAAGW